jgi:hypothetical protein
MLANWTGLTKQVAKKSSKILGTYNYKRVIYIREKFHLNYLWCVLVAGVVAKNVNSSFGGDGRLYPVHVYEART